MKIGDYTFERVQAIEPVRAADGEVILFLPQERYANVRKLPLNSYGAGPFCKFKISSRFAMSGVYVIVIDGTVVYVGETVNLSARFNAGYGNISPKNCFIGGQETNCRVNNLICTAASARRNIEIWFFGAENYKEIEAALRSAARLAWNRV